MIDTEQYIEVAVRLEPFSQESAEILMAELSDLPYDSFAVEEPFLKCYIPMAVISLIIFNFPNSAAKVQIIFDIRKIFRRKIKKNRSRFYPR